MIGLAVLAAVVVVGAIAQWQLAGNVRVLKVIVPVLLLLAAAPIRPGTLAGSLVVAGTAAAGWVFGRPVVGAIAGVGLLGYGYARSRRLPPDLQPAALQRAPDDAVGVGAEGFVEQFTRLGYRQVGALTTPVSGFQLIITIMSGPAGDRYASVTDAVLTVTSTFGFRTLVTRNSASSLLAPEMLDNPVVGGAPAELDAAHTAALSLLTAQLPVDTLNPEDTTERAMAGEVREIAWVREQPSHLRRGGNRRAIPLVADPRVEDRIAAWLDAPAPAHERP